MGKISMIGLIRIGFDWTFPLSDDSLGGAGRRSLFHSNSWQRGHDRSLDAGERVAEFAGVLMGNRGTSFA